MKETSPIVNPAAEKFNEPYNPKETEEKIYRLWPACNAMPARMTCVSVSGGRYHCGQLKIITNVR
jgi:uncharacterized protein YbdZ (MbtH family)